MSRREKNWEFTYTSAAQSIYALLQYTDKKEDYSLTDVMGLTGHAFRINIHPENVSPAGTTMFSPTELLEKGLRVLGLTAEHLYGFRTPAPPEKLQEAIEFAKESIDRGIPVIGWSLFIPEFGIIYGYDDEKQELYCKDIEREGALPYAKLNELPLNFVFMLRVRDSLPVDAKEAWKAALASILEFSRGEAPTLSQDFKHGITGYDAWMQAFRNRTIDPFGNAYNVEVVCCAREFAVQFFREFPKKWAGHTPLEQEMLSLAEEAAEQYEQVADALRQMELLFPIPQGGEPNDPIYAEQAITLLTAAKAAEEQGVGTLQRMYEAILREEEQRKSEDEMPLPQ